MEISSGIFIHFLDLNQEQLRKMVGIEPTALPLVGIEPTADLRFRCSALTN